MCPYWGCGQMSCHRARSVACFASAAAAVVVFCYGPRCCLTGNQNALKPGWVGAKRGHECPGAEGCLRHTGHVKRSRSPVGHFIPSPTGQLPPEKHRRG